MTLEDRLENIAEKVNEHRAFFGNAKAELCIRLTKRLKDYIKEKKNIGFDMALLLLVSDEPDLEETFRTYVKSEQLYKGGEIVYAAIDTKIKENQSQRKFYGKVDGGGEWKALP